MIVTIDTDKKEIVIEKATVQEIYEYVAKFGLLDYTIVPKLSHGSFPIERPFWPYFKLSDINELKDLTSKPADKQPHIKKGTIQPPHYSTGSDLDIDNYFKAYYNII